MATSELYWQDTDCEIHRIVVGPLANNVLFVRCRHTGESIMVDAADEHGKLLELCQALDTRTVLETHGHFDHIGALTEVRDAGYEVGVTAEDAYRLPSYDYILEDDTEIEVGQLRIQTMKTPGHTEGSICFKIKDKPVRISGDTLFHGGPGRTDLPGGDWQTILKSLDQRLSLIHI